MNIVDDLSNAIDHWLREKEGRSIARLARISGSSETTLNRVLKKSNKTFELEGVMDLVFVLFPKNEALAFLSNYFPQFAKWQDVVLSRGDNSKYDWYDYFQNPDYLTLIIAADKKDGATRDLIRNKLGYYGLQKASELAAAGVITEKGDRFYASETFLNISNQKTQTNMIKGFCEIYDERNAEIPRKAVKAVGWGAVDDNTLDRIYELGRKFEKDMVELISEPKNKGNNPVFYGYIQNILKD